jgi:hypothetical protein
VAAVMEIGDGGSVFAGWLTPENMPEPCSHTALHLEAAESSLCGF